MVVIGGFSGIMEDNALLFSPGELTCPMSYICVNRPCRNQRDTVSYLDLLKFEVFGGLLKSIWS